MLRELKSCISDLGVSGLNQLIIFIMLQKCIFVSGIRATVLNTCLMRCTMKQVILREERLVTADSSSFQTECVPTKETEGGLKTI